MISKSPILLIALIIVVLSSCKTRKYENLDCRSVFIYETLFFNILEDGYRNIAFKIQYKSKIDSVVLGSKCAFDIFQLKSKSEKRYIKTFYNLIYNDDAYLVDSLQYDKFKKFIIHNDDNLDSLYNLGKNSFVNYCKNNANNFTDNEILHAIYLLYRYNIFGWKETKSGISYLYFEEFNCELPYPTWPN